MHILLLIGSIPLKAITLVLSVFISMENSDAVLFKLCTKYCKLVFNKYINIFILGRQTNCGLSWTVDSLQIISSHPFGP
jgi:hypothetical protein